MSPIDIEQFRFEDYKLKLANLTAHSDRMWTRFNYFITIEAGLVGLFVIAGLHRLGFLVWGTFAEFLVSLAWWVVGARDRFLGAPREETWSSAPKRCSSEGRQSLTTDTRRSVTLTSFPKRDEMRQQMAEVW